MKPNNCTLNAKDSIYSTTCCDAEIKWKLLTHWLSRRTELIYEILNTRGQENWKNMENSNRQPSGIRSQDAHFSMLQTQLFRYEKAGTHRSDIPRMLSDHPQQLQIYMTKTKDK